MKPKPSRSSYWQFTPSVSQRLQGRPPEHLRLRVRQWLHAWPQRESGFFARLVGRALWAEAAVVEEAVLACPLPMLMAPEVVVCTLSAALARTALLLRRRAGLGATAGGAMREEEEEGAAVGGEGGEASFTARYLTRPAGVAARRAGRAAAVLRRAGVREAAARETEVPAPVSGVPAVAAPVVGAAASLAARLRRPWGCC